MALTTIDKSLVKTIIKARDPNAHKGDFGHGAIIAGSKGMMGAAILSSRAFVRSGGGKLTTHIPQCGYEIMQVSVPEAMSFTEAEEEFISAVTSPEKYDALGVGPGIGQYPSHEAMLSKLFNSVKGPIVVDADALNIIAKNNSLLQQLPRNAILTPHVAEFERIFGKCSDHEQRTASALLNASKYNVIIILKGAHTLVALPQADGYINTTGNPGMATGGTGDVLTGIITGMLAQKLSPKDAAIASVYLHGSAGDIAATERSQYSMIASDLIENLGKAFLKLHE